MLSTPYNKLHSPYKLFYADFSDLAKSIYRIYFCILLRFPILLGCMFHSIYMTFKPIQTDIPTMKLSLLLLIYDILLHCNFRAVEPISWTFLGSVFNFLYAASPSLLFSNSPFLRLTISTISERFHGTLSDVM